MLLLLLVLVLVLVRQWHRMGLNRLFQEQIEACAVQCSNEILPLQHHQHPPKVLDVNQSQHTTKASSCCNRKDGCERRRLL
jgi:hypothetical protein